LVRSEAPAEANKFDLFVKIFGENSVYPIYSGFVKGVDLSQLRALRDCDGRNARTKAN
jgi:hypothetical protein